MHASIATNIFPLFFILFFIFFVWRVVYFLSFCMIKEIMCDKIMTYTIKQKVVVHKICIYMHTKLRFVNKMYTDLFYFCILLVK